jgi:PBP1b-binding outer membrane lipoprotein LpoB
MAMKLQKFFGLLLAATLFTGCSHGQEPAPNANAGDASSVEAAALPVI